MELSSSIMRIEDSGSTILYCYISSIDKHSDRLWVERMAVQELLDTALGSSATIAHHPDGKPYLIDHPAVYISITHTEGLVALALSDSPIGIDAEPYGDQVERVSSRFCLASELEYHLDKLHLHPFLTLWSAKESLYKRVNPPSRSLKSFEMTHYEAETPTQSKLIMRYLDPPHGTYTLRALYLPHHILTYTIF